MKTNILIVILVGGLFFLFQSFNPKPLAHAPFPDEVTKLLVSACYDCHSNDVENEKAREALNFEKWDEYRLTKKVGLLGKIGEVVKEDKMPPAKYLEFKPDRKPTEPQKQVIIEWAKQEASALMGGE